MTETVSILLIEDDLVDQMAFCAQVKAEKLPYLFEVAETVVEARRLLNTCEFDLIVTDYQLRDGNSFELFDELAGKLVIFMTGAGDEETAVRALRLGVRDYLIKDPERQYLKLLSTRVDIALRQWRNERALQESEERYRDLSEISNDLIQCVGMDGKFLYVNRAWREALGYGEDEISALSELDIHDPSSRSRCMESFKRVIAGETLRGIEATLVGKNGCEVLVEGSSRCQLENGKPVATRSIFRDVTEKKRAENALRAKNEELELALAEVKQLQGILPICMYCKKIRDDGDYWQEVEAYVQHRTAAEFSHGICPACFETHHPGVPQISGKKKNPSALTTV